MIGQHKRRIRIIIISHAIVAILVLGALADATQDSGRSFWFFLPLNLAVLVLACTILFWWLLFSRWRQLQPHHLHLLTLLYLVGLFVTITGYTMVAASCLGYLEVPSGTHWYAYIILIVEGTEFFLYKILDGRNRICALTRDGRLNLVGPIGGAAGIALGRLTKR